MSRDELEAYKTIKEYRRYLTRQQVKTLAGQVKAGEHAAAMGGLNKLLARAGIKKG